MPIQTLSDQELLKQTKQVVTKEREVLVEVLNHLREVERRRLFAMLKYRSMYDYATKELGYSEDQAYRRINAMRLIQEIPTIEESIACGSLSLSSLSAAASVIHAESKQLGVAASAGRKFELIMAVQGQSRREAEIILQKMTGTQTLKKESTKISNNQVEIKMLMATEDFEKIERLKGLWAHSYPGISDSELFTMLCEQALSEHEKQLKKSRATKKPRVETEVLKNVAIDVRRNVWDRANSRCENCGSGWALQVDHKVPKSKGGSNKSENLRLLCRHCNQRAAIESFGLNKIQRFLGPHLG